MTTPESELLRAEIRGGALARDAYLRAVDRVYDLEREAERGQARGRDE